MQKFIIKIENNQPLPAGDDVCCYLADEQTDAKLVKQAAAGNLLVLGCGENAADVCKKYNLDGAVIEIDEKQPVKKQVAAFLEKIGPKKFWGALIRPSRHIAMLAAETEPDFVAFRTDGKEPRAEDIIKWYNELFLIQSAVVFKENLADSLFNACDFVILTAGEYKILVDKIKRLD